ncbi:kynureninase [Alicyclobacillus dauci]|uniref:Kynureninase n=1 Tax=Alicyclobacillus dauci TaxID=1475485 RepID=A0ABY6YZG2_9BACL|nr:kynureninase [Alicyclobacillus dauci]WAH36012.1 kynureninase [Alicyclobacillus dauci]
MPNNEEILAGARALDARDQLASFRSEFYLHENVVYLDGNSLGLLSKPSEDSLYSVIEQWKTLAIDGWQEGMYPWYDLSEKLGARVAELIGASPQEVIVTGSTTINLHQILSSFYHPTDKRNVILADELTFPSDLYAISSHLSLHGQNPGTYMRLASSRSEHLLEEDDIVEAMADDVALIVLPSVLYRSGQLLDIPRLTRAAHDRGILIAWDLCHSLGAVPHALSEWGVDFAFWCHYKYLNSGPGGVAGLYVNERHLGSSPGIAGWFSSDKSTQFDMTPSLRHATDAGAFQVGTPHVLSVAPLIGSLNLFEEARMERIREKSLQLTNYLMSLIDSELASYGFTVINPREAPRRGGHVALTHPEAVRIAKALKAAKVIPDFRAPNIIRLAPVALYTSFEDVAIAVLRLKSVMESKEYEKFANQRDIIA